MLFLHDMHNMICIHSMSQIFWFLNFCLLGQRLNSLPYIHRKDLRPIHLQAPAGRKTEGGGGGVDEGISHCKAYYLSDRNRQGVSESANFYIAPTRP